MARNKVQAIGGRIAESLRKRARKAPARKKTLFEALEQRFLLSAELVVPPPPPPQPTLEEPLQIDQPGQVQVKLEVQNAPQTDTKAAGQDLSQTNPVQDKNSPAAPSATAASATLDTATPRPVAGTGIKLSDFAAFIQSRPAASQVVIVDASIPQVDAVVNGVLDAIGQEKDTQNPSADPANADAVVPQASADSKEPLLRWVQRDGVDVIVLDSHFDGLEQLTSILSAYHDLDAVQVLSHGDSGAMVLGTTRLSGDNLDQHRQEVASWGNALRQGGDILLYGCDIAQGAYGVNFVRSLSELTGADVAASTGLTGSAAKGGDWVLEQATGNIEVQSFKLNAYAYLLDTVSGTVDADTLVSSATDDYITGLAGDDTYKFSDGWGVDTVLENVGEGTDTLDFSLVTTDLTFTIHANGSIDISDDGATPNTVHASGVENLIGGRGINTFIFEDGATLAGRITGNAGGGDVLDFSQYTTAITLNLATDTLTGTQGVTNIGRIIGGSGVNTLYGANEDATWKITAAKKGSIGNYLVFEGFDHLVGGTASDTIDYSDYASAVTVDLAAKTATGFASVTNFNNVIGSAFADSITGDDADNLLSGGLGNDTITGGGGHDTLVEVRDADMVLTDTTLTIGSEVDTFSGIESASLSGGAGNNTLDASAVTALTVELYGDDGNDILKGGALDDVLMGGLDDDTLIGGAGDDTLTGGGGVDTIDGGTGTNTLEEAENARFVLTDSTLDMAQGTSEVQTISFTGTVTGGSFALEFNGESTSLIAFDATAQAVRAALLKLSNIGEGDVQVSGTPGAWTVTFSGSLAGMNVADMTAVSSLVGGSVNVAVTTAGTKVTSSLTNIQRAVLSGGVGNNLMDASAFTGSVVLRGGYGDDILIGGSGDDELDGGMGDDRLTGGLGTDTIIGGGGNDMLIETRDADMTLENTKLTIAGAETDVLSGIERATLTGGAGDNTIDASKFTGISVDTSLSFLNKGSGVDTVAGKSDLRITLSDGTTVVDVDLSYAVTLQEVFDAIHAADSKLSAALNASGNAIVITDSAGGNVAVKVEALNGSSAASQLGLLGTGTKTGITGTAIIAGSVTLDGGAGADTLKGSSGDDILTGGLGADTLDGGGGTDTIVETRDANMTLTNSKLTIGSEGDDTLTSIERAILTGGASANTLDASAFTLGAVALYSGGGKDTLKGGSVDDEFYVDVSGLTIGDKVTVSAGGGTGNKVYVQGAGNLDANDLNWVDFGSDTTTQLVFKGKRGETLTLDSDLTAQGKNLSFEYEAIKLTAHTIDTSNTSGTAGSITLKGSDIEIGNGAKLLAVGKAGANGAITIEAEDLFKDFAGFGFANVDVETASVRIAGATISGGDVTITATAAAQRFDIDFGESDVGSALTSAADGLLGTLDSFSVIAGVSVVSSYAGISIDQATNIQSANFTARTSATGVASPNPTGYGLGVAVGVVNTTSVVTVAGNINATGTITIRADSDNTLNVVSKPSSVMGYDAAVAVSVLVSNTTANVTDQARLTAGQDIFVWAETIDRNRTLAQSITGPEGKAALAVAISVEHGQTNAWLDGTADAGRNISVEARQSQDVLTEKLFFGTAPTVVNGVSAASGVGSNSNGDVLSDAEDTIKDSVKTKAANFIKSQQKLQFIQTAKDKVVTTVTDFLKKSDFIKKQLESEATNSFDLGGAIAVQVDINDASAHIGDGTGTLLEGGADVEADGDITVNATVEDRPAISASTSVQNETEKAKQKNASLGVAVALSVGVLKNDTDAHIAGNAAVDAKGKLTVSAQTLNQIDPLSLWGANLVSPFLPENTQATYESNAGSTTVKDGDTVEVSEGHSAGGEVGNWYRYIGAVPEQTLDLSQQDFTDTAQWEEIGNPARAIGTNFITNLTGYLNDGLGLGNNLIDSWSQANADGQVKAGAGSATALILDHSAKATIQSGAQINQDADGSSGSDDFRTGNQEVVIEASSVNQAVNLVGNFETPGISGGTEAKNWTKDSIKFLPSGGVKSAPEGSAVGVGFGFYWYDNDVAAKIEDAAAVYADSLDVTADTNVLAVVLGASGGEAGNVGANGAVAASIVNNSTLAQIDNGASVTVGLKKLAGSDSVARVRANDTSHVISVAGAVATSGHVGFGASVGVNVIMRSTDAVVGSIER